MQTIETRINVEEDRKLMIQLPASLPIGDYEVVLVLHNHSAPGAGQKSIQAAQSLLRRFVPAGRELSMELIQERREEGLHE